MSTTTATTNSIVLIEATRDSLTVSWPATPGAERYILQYRHETSPNYETLSDQLTTPQARKRNLAVNNDDNSHGGFIFRAAAVVPGSSSGTENNETSMCWITHREPFRLLSPAEEQQRPKAPQAFLGGSNATLRVTWEAAATPEATYELQMRENTPGMDWTTSPRH